MSRKLHPEGSERAALRGRRQLAALLTCAATAVHVACSPPPEPTEGGGDGDAGSSRVASGAPTFHGDVAAIVFQHCAPCHRAGEIAPFPLTTYQEVRQHARQIVEVTARREMPPWKPEPGHAEFVGERRLSGDQIATLAEWVKAGAPRGSGAAPPLPAFPTGWRLGQPDHVVRFSQPYWLRAEGPDVFRNFVLPLAGVAGRFVRAVELRPGARGVVHHANILADTTSTARQLDGRDIDLGYSGMVGAVAPGGHFFGWTPGKVPVPLEEGAAWRVEPGTDLVLEMHMLPSGKREELLPEIGLYFTDRPPRRSPATLHLGSTAMDIPAGDATYVVRDRFLLPAAVEVEAIYPHAHHLGKDLRVYAELPLPEQGRVELLWIRDWDFMWQDEYHYKTPVALPRGAVIHLVYTYDNSDQNPRNPHQPPQRVRWGPKTSDEMADAFLKVYPQEAGDLAKLQRALFDKDLAIYLDGFRLRLRDDPDEVDAHDRLGRSLLTLGETTRALEHIDRAIALAPELAHLHYNRALALGEMGRTAEALAAYDRALALRPDHPSSHGNRAGLLATLGRFAEAQKAYRRALELDPETVAHLTGLALVEQRLGNRQRAEGLYRQALQLDPRDPQIHSNLSTLYLQSGDPLSARRHLERALALEPDFVEAHKNLATLEASLGNLDAAIARLERVIGIAPADAEAHYRLALSRIQGGELEAAERSFAAALAVGPDHGQIHLDLGNLLVLSDRNAEAVERFRRAVELLHDSADAALALAGSLFAAGRPREAVPVLSTFLRRQPQHVEARITLARMLALSGDLERAASEIERVLELEPDHGEALELRSRIERARRGR